jgi:AcrR family transcriptional regulator
MDISHLPPSLQVLWGRQQHPRRGPRPTLSIDAVVRAAIDIADADGLGAVSMSRVAERLGFTPMSLYRYVKNKDELLLLMTDAANEAPPSRPTPDDWRRGIEEWARAIFAAFRRHPWLLQVPISGPPAGPSQLGWMEAGLQNLTGVELHEGHKLQIIQLLHGYVRGEAQLSIELSRPDPKADTAAQYGAILRAVIGPETHPALTRMVDSGLLDGPTGYDEDVDFEFGLSTILDGIALLIDRVSPKPT